MPEKEIEKEIKKEREIEKKNIKLEIKDQINKGRVYSILKVPEKENEMDTIEKYVYDWIFNGKEIVELSDRLEKLPKEKDANEKFEQLNKMVEMRLSKMGANKKSVPIALRKFNIFLFVISILVVIRHIIFNGINNMSMAKSMTILMIILFAMIGIITALLNIVIIIRHHNCTWKLFNSR